MGAAAATRLSAKRSKSKERVRPARSHFPRIKRTVAGPITISSHASAATAALALVLAAPAAITAPQGNPASRGAYLAADSDPEAITRGAYLATAAGCADCHTDREHGGE